MASQFLCFAILLLVYVSASGAGSLVRTYQEVDKNYYKQRPPLHEFKSVANRIVNPNAYHSKRCSLAEVGNAIRAFKSSTFDTNGQAVLVSTPCLFTDSLGNWLSNYFESVLCARAARMHYMAVAKVWEPATNDTPSAFVSRLPSLMEHSNAATIAEAMSTVEQICTCPGNCHERANALWTKGSSVIKPLMGDALRHHYSTLQQPTTVVKSSDLSTVAVGKELPFVPDVAIHYRCGDNFVGHYGFLPFSAFKRYVPEGAKTIYVLADKRGRKTDAKQHRAAKCDAIFSALFDYLRAAFPSASVVIRRGDDLYHDLLRLAFAETTICSVSTFCLWPAVASNHTAYFPQTKLVARGDTSLRLGFQWITQPAVVLGAPYESRPTAQLLAVLST